MANIILDNVVGGLYYLIGGIILLAVGLGVFFAILFAKKKTGLDPFPEAKIEDLILRLGGEENVVSATSEGGRVAFTLKNLKRADLEGIRALGATGIFVAGSRIKALFPFDVSGLAARFDRRG